ncbi:MAG: hypothetical protein COZ20_02075 [Gallionellales bacterium CG_4_10_14_3_um_filter_54_96]|nr:MAG: hypothetical protein COS43_00760 [Gallionellales bacterium CG03_land_8_20_14_0_80_55_15]PIV91633.1 MAG: hypothetical protein COW45_04435 [Gallionellales bacterium CG17_big_fil_post_rev_8_21_14_2_50_54_146]PIY06115.1 MAG: hypothetical protein COZ20_02075 [Gallionellales bacterium CG_4_10_14_3_um_filter_54_96]PJC05569.1 MAG: hypothetical protein CO070_01925 [Gallionellales bacterium CG_4_9_14_0_8_um_filter_55_61]
MNKATIKAFILWLENATDEEIEAHRQLILSKIKSVSRDGMADVRLALRLIDEEVLARVELRRAS